MPGRVAVHVPPSPSAADVVRLDCTPSAAVPVPMCLSPSARVGGGGAPRGSLSVRVGSRATSLAHSVTLPLAALASPSAWRSSMFRKTSQSQRAAPSVNAGNVAPLPLPLPLPGVDVAPLPRHATGAGWAAASDAPSSETPTRAPVATAASVAALHQEVVALRQRLDEWLAVKSDAKPS